MRGLAFGIFAALAIFATPVSAADLTLLSIKPSKLDPGVRAFDEPSLAVVPQGVRPQAPLVLFLTGTGGHPKGVLPFISVIAESGFRVLALEYDDTPAVSQVCPEDPDPGCSANFRQMRIDGDGPPSPVHNPPAEAIIPRLRAALRALVKSDQTGGWSPYLSGDDIQWRRIIVSGLSQGAGMAAFIAKHHAVARVVLFSSPWDVTGPDHHPAAWLSEPSRTPKEQWFAEVHQKEKTVELIKNAYIALNIPPENIRIFDKDLPPDAPQSPNPYHVMTIRDQRYITDWRFLYGDAAKLASEAPQN